MLVSPEGSSTAPSTIFIGHEPSARWVAQAHAYARSAASGCPPTSSAIADSRWFHTSVCSPGVQGTAPSGSCIAAIDAAVRATSTWLRTPSTDGTQGTSCASGGIGLAEVEDEALADERVEHLAGVLEGLRLLHALQDQQAVV